MTDSPFDDQELSERKNGRRHPPPPEQQVSRGLSICRYEHRTLRVTWRGNLASDTVYRLCLDCNTLYTIDWGGGGVYDARTLLRFARPVRRDIDRIKVIRRFFYRGWPTWWLQAHGLRNLDVDVSFDTIVEGG